MIRRLTPLALVLCLFVSGCGGEGGTAGDDSDPATTTDVEAMSDETGDVNTSGDTE